MSLKPRSLRFSGLESTSHKINYTSKNRDKLSLGYGLLRLSYKVLNIMEKLWKEAKRHNFSTQYLQGIGLDYSEFYLHIIYKK